jgi:D-aspartate ligase
MKRKNQSVTPVLLGGDLNAYSMAMAFARAEGAVSHVFARDRLAVTDFSPYIKLHVVKNLDSCDVAVPALLEFAKEHEGERLLLIPCADWYMEMLEYARDALSGHFYFHIPQFEIWRAASDKHSFYSLLDKHFIPYPRTVRSDAAGCFKNAMTLKKPLVLKPSDSAEYWRHPFVGMKKVYFPKSVVEAEEIARKIYSAGYEGKILLQEQILSDSGAFADASVLTTYSDSRGRVLRAVLGDVLLEERGPTARGNYSAIVTRPLDELSKKLIGLLDSIGYKGIANFDIISASGKSYCLELNPRQGRSADYVRAAGVNLARLLLAQMRGEKIEPSFNYTDVLWCTVPMSCVRRFAENRALLRRAERLREKGQIYSPYDFGSDMNFMRKIYVYIHQRRQAKIFDKYGKRVYRCF